MCSVRRRRFVRKGMSSVQTALMLVAIAIVVIAGVRVLGRSTRGELNNTATYAADPTSLVDRWGQ
jgi:flagellin-like protein